MFRYVLYLITFFYLVYGTTYLFKSKKSLTTDKFVALILMYPLNVLAILIQLFWAGCLIEMFMTTVSMLLITTEVQKPEETINPVFGVRRILIAVNACYPLGIHLIHICRQVGKSMMRRIVMTV